MGTLCLGEALVAVGAQLAVVTLGADGALARGRESHDVPGAMQAACTASARVTESWGAVA